MPTVSRPWEPKKQLNFRGAAPFLRTVVVRREARFALATSLTLGLCAAITVPARTSSATSGNGGVATATIGGNAGQAAAGTPGLARINGVGGRAAAGGAPATAVGAHANTGTNSGGNAAPTKVSSAGAKASAGVIAPVGLDRASRPTWRGSEVVLTVDPSYLALPYAQQALEGALLAWTATADQLPRVILRYTDESMGTQSAAENLADHRIFFAPSGDKRANGALAITLVTADEEKNSILDADILVNGGHLFTDVAVTGKGQSASVAYDLQDVIAHELGHWFGLDEEYENGESTMYAYVYPRETKKRDLHESDILAVQLAYWQADNPSENRGCSLNRTSTSTDPLDAIGWVAVVGLLVRRRNRRHEAHVPGQNCRLHA